VFADARQRWAGDAIRELVANFHDPEVGGVTGELILRSELPAGATDSTTGEGVGLYWKYEKWLRRHESLVRSTNGATGAIYALRRSLWQPLPRTTLLDDVLAPMRVVLAGKRIVRRARAFDPALPNCAAEDVARPARLPELPDPGARTEAASAVREPGVDPVCLTRSVAFWRPGR
jgi:cellulose synthase/poly-beta-1,6-N-acetylglucosamine synthase-like glycosyltransferase